MSHHTLDSMPPNRVYWQYRNKPRLNALVNIGLDSARKMGEDLNRIKNGWDVNTAIGHDLDVIGEIVDFKRPSAVEHNLAVEHYYGDGQYGDGSQYNSFNPSALAPIDDDRYRILLKAKIAKNSSKGTMDDIARAVLFITDVDCQVIDNHDMTFSLLFFGQLTDIQREMIESYDLVPEPLGVNYLGKTETATLTGYGESQYGERSQYNALIN